MKKLLNALSFFMLFASFSSHAVQVGDKVVRLEVEHFSRDSNVRGPYVVTLEATKVDPSANLLTLSLKTESHVINRTSVIDASFYLYQELEQRYKYCETKLETIYVAAGTFQTCKVIIKEPKYNQITFYGDVLGGLVHQEIYSKDGRLMRVITLQSQQKN